LPVSSGETLIAAVKAAERDKQPGFDYWLNIPDELKPGKQDEAKAVVVVEHRDDQDTPDRGLLHIQFWFFYGFNGPGKFHLTIGDITDVHVEIDTCGRHYGDWEHVTLELEPVGEEWRLRRVKLSRHSFTIWKDYLSPLERKGIERLKIYVARDSHGHYERPGNHDYSHSKHVDFKLGKLDVWLYDMAGNGAEFATSDPSHYEIVSSDFAAHEVPEPAWLSFDGHWGQFEKLDYRRSDLREELGDLAKFFAGRATHAFLRRSAPDRLAPSDMVRILAPRSDIEWA